MNTRRSLRARRIVTTLLATCLGIAASAQNSVPRGAYITRPVVSGADLGRLVQGNRTVKQRYIKAWSLSEAETLKQFKGIRLGKMPKTTPMNVYYFRPQTNMWGYKLRLVKKGTAVFLKPDGTPFLMKICGNPIQKPQKPIPQLSQASIPAFDASEQETGLKTDVAPDSTPEPFSRAECIAALSSVEGGPTEGAVTEAVPTPEAPQSTSAPTAEAPHASPPRGGSSGGFGASGGGGSSPSAPSGPGMSAPSSNSSSGSSGSSGKPRNYSNGTRTGPLPPNTIVIAEESPLHLDPTVERLSSPEPSLLSLLAIFGLGFLRKRPTL